MMRFVLSTKQRAVSKTHCSIRCSLLMMLLIFSSWLENRSKTIIPNKKYSTKYFLYDEVIFTNYIIIVLLSNNQFSFHLHAQ